MKYEDQSPFLHFPPLLKPQLPSSARKPLQDASALHFLALGGKQLSHWTDMNAPTPCAGASESLNGRPCKTLRGLYLGAYFAFNFFNEKILCGRVLSSSQLCLVWDRSENLMKAWGQGRGEGRESRVRPGNQGQLWFTPPRAQQTVPFSSCLNDMLTRWF